MTYRKNGEDVQEAEAFLDKKLADMGCKTPAVIMPEERIRKTLDDIEVGESFWTCPFYLQITEGNACYLEGNTWTDDKKGGGTHKMLVTKKEGGVSCTIYGWELFSRGKGVPIPGSYPVLSLEFMPERDRRSSRYHRY
jgi:hypothetical protein